LLYTFFLPSERTRARSFWWGREERGREEKREKRPLSLEKLSKAIEKTINLSLSPRNKMTVAPQLEFFPRAGTVSLEGKTLVVVRFFAFAFE
jgi:hypothetical protein